MDGVLQLSPISEQTTAGQGTCEDKNESPPITETT